MENFRGISPKEEEFILPDLKPSNFESEEVHVKVEQEEEGEREDEFYEDWEYSANLRIKKEEIDPEEDSESRSEYEEKFSVSTQKFTKTKAKRGKGRPWKRFYDKFYYCQICSNREFRKHSSYLHHLNQHELIKEKEGQDRPIRRFARYKTSTNGPGLKNRRKVEEEIELVKCELCHGREFSRPRYNSHLIHHKKIREKEGKDRAILTLQERNEMKKAKRIEFAGVKEEEQNEFKCGICPDRMFDRMDRYVSHLHCHTRIRRKEGKDRPIGESIIPRRKKNKAQKSTCTEVEEKPKEAVEIEESIIYEEIF